MFQSHMWDGSAVPLDENLKIAQELLELTKAANIILEIEVGVVGGEEDGVVAEINEKLYTTPDDFIATLDALGLPEDNSYIVAATFGNVHGVYKPGGVKLRPTVLKDGQDCAGRQARPGRRLEAVLAGVPRRIRLVGGGDRRGGVLRRDQDEHRHRHPVRLHPAARRSLLPQLRRCAEDRRRGRQQEGLRPASATTSSARSPWATGLSRPASSWARPGSRCPPDPAALHDRRVSGSPRITPAAPGPHRPDAAGV